MLNCGFVCFNLLFSSYLLIYFTKEKRKQTPTVKLIVLGKGQIGKTTLVNYLKYCNESSVKVSNYLR